METQCESEMAKNHISDALKAIFEFYLNEYSQVLCSRCCKYWHSIFHSVKTCYKKTPLACGRFLETGNLNAARYSVQKCQQRAAREGDLTTLKFIMQMTDSRPSEGCFENAIAGGNWDVFFFLTDPIFGSPSFYFEEFCRAAKYCTTSYLYAYFTLVSHNWPTSFHFPTDRSCSIISTNGIDSFETWLRRSHRVPLSQINGLLGGAIWQGNLELFVAILKETSWTLDECAADHVTSKSFPVLEYILRGNPTDVVHHKEKSYFVDRATKNILYTNDTIFCDKMKKLYEETGCEFKITDYAIEECAKRCALSVLDWIDDKIRFVIDPSHSTYTYGFGDSSWDANLSLTPHPLELEKGKTAMQVKSETLLWLAKHKIIRRYNLEDVLFHFGCEKTIVKAVELGYFIPNDKNSMWWWNVRRHAMFNEVLTLTMELKLYDATKPKKVIPLLIKTNRLDLLTKEKNLKDVENLLFPGCWGLFAKLGNADAVRWLFEIGYPFPDSFRKAASKFKNPMVKRVFEENGISA
jgi:hypothetical protein